MKPGGLHPEEKTRMWNSKSVGAGSRFRLRAWMAASAGAIPQRPPCAMAHIGVWPAPWTWPGHLHASGGQAQGSSGPRMVAERREGASSDAVIRMARRKRIWICRSLSPVIFTRIFYIGGAAQATLRAGTSPSSVGNALRE